MSEPFLGEIRMFGFNFPPRGWATCDGQLLPIAQNQALFSLLGITYGGDGRTTFALPDLRGRTPIESSSQAALGRAAGEENHTLIVAEMPAHSHSLLASADPATAPLPANGMLAQSTANYYAPPSNVTAMSPSLISPTGGGAPHNNMQPFLVLNFSIALSGVFPSRT